MRKPFEPKEKKIYRLKRTPLKRKPYKIRSISKKRAKELREYGKLKKKLNIKKCLKCGIEYEDYKDIDLHHKQSRGRCGTDSEDNLEGLCRKCHMKETGILGLKTLELEPNLKIDKTFYPI